MMGGVAVIKAMLDHRPAEIATTLVRPGGTFAVPFGSSRGFFHATTVPSLLSARLWKVPAAMATTLDKPAGGVRMAAFRPPQPTTVPSLFKARLWKPPAA